MQRPGKVSVGFTLVEVLISIAIFAVVATICYSTLSQYLLVRERLQQNHASLQVLQRFFTLVERDLRYVTERSVRDELGENEPPFMVENEYGLPGEVLRFTTTYPDTIYPGFSRLERVAWRLEDGDLFRNVWPFLDREQDSEPTEQQILGGIETLELSFFSWDEELGVKQVDFDSLNGTVPYGVELLVTMVNETTYQRVFDLANGQ